MNNNESWLITRTPYLIGTILVAGVLTLVCNVFQKHGAYPILWLAPMPIWGFIILAGSAFASGLPGGVQMPRCIVFPTLYMTWPMGLAALVIYGMVAYPVFEIPVWVMIPGGAVLAAASSAILGNIFEYEEIAKRWSFKGWLTWRWSWTGFALTVLTIAEAVVLGFAMRTTPAMVSWLLVGTTAIKLAACFTAPWRYNAPQAATC